MLRLLLCAAVLPGSMARAAGSPAELCEKAAAEAADRFDVPRSVMMAISLAETGRQEGSVLRPWPWAVNFDGDGHWFATKAEAIEAALARQVEGLSNFDVGCFQINYRWHGDAFASLDDMIDPEANAAYAAQFLVQLHQQHGSWEDAAAAYHSSTTELASAYRARFEALQDGLTTATEAIAERVNHFPLLRPGAAGSPGSIVPVQVSLGPMLLRTP